MANRVVFRVLVVMLMVLPQIGHAACAWVLWKKHAAPLVDIAWSIMGSSETSDKCEKALAEEFQRRLSAHKKSDVVESITSAGKGSIQTRVIYGGQQFDTVVTYYCLPDTVDPRK